MLENNRQNDPTDQLKTTRVGIQLHQFWMAIRQVQSIQIKR